MTNVFQILTIQLRPYGVLLKQKPKEGKNCGFKLSNNRRTLKDMKAWQMILTHNS
jgi:hypothetical protein